MGTSHLPLYNSLLLEALLLLPMIDVIGAGDTEGLGFFRRHRQFQLRIVLFLLVIDQVLAYYMVVVRPFCIPHFVLQAGILWRS